MNFGMNHATGTGLIGWHVNLQSSVLPLCYDCPQTNAHIAHNDIKLHKIYKFCYQARSVETTTMKTSYAELPVIYSAHPEGKDL